jgi:hypothetical protein
MSIRCSLWLRKLTHYDNVLCSKGGLCVAQGSLGRVTPRHPSIKKGQRIAIAREVVTFLTVLANQSADEIENGIPEGKTNRR